MLTNSVCFTSRREKHKQRKLVCCCFVSDGINTLASNPFLCVFSNSSSAVSSFKGSSSNFTTNRNQRRSSFGSISTSLNSSKGQLEDSTSGSFKKMSVPDQIGSTSSVNSSPLVRTKFTGTDTSIEYCTRPMEDVEQNTDSGSWEDRPSTPTILGYEVMEERAKFTVYKILVKRSSEESWVVFRRYTDFSRLNDKLKDMFPGFRLALPPKRWFKDNYNPDFLEDRQLGLQAFLQNLVAHKDIANCLAVREFLCLDDPPGPFDSLEESRAFCETLEETNYRLQKELLDKQREVESLKKLLNEKQLHIEAIEKKISSDKETREACWSGSLAESSVPEIEVAEVAYTADEEE
ncbi:PREDICTED: sorting nexin-16 isoform X3 [Gavialis gangeticus]|uniref:sorting nexin-16 isoform X3 n=1 Tax=Gavialis gangeticus TaxID=94835 RepID=UPI00092E229D|nr:PREDICTED: sorting nexin-16 isoform X3 [Gavialis gangeticus]